MTDNKYLAWTSPVFFALSVVTILIFLLLATTFSDYMENPGIIILVVGTFSLLATIMGFLSFRAPQAKVGGIGGLVILLLVLFGIPIGRETSVSDPQPKITYQERAGHTGILDIDSWNAPASTFPSDPTGPLATPTPHMDIPPLTLNGLKNAEYRVIVNGMEQTIRMINGQYQIGTDPTSPGFLTVTVNDLAVFGDLNGDRVDDAAIILSEWYGRTGINVYVAAVTNWAGIPLHKASVLIDDRAIIQLIQIENGLIIVNALAHGVNDPGCCPSQQVTRIFRLVDQSLVEQ